jgi:4-amino-4-deoxy-L-arabinose transferase-like glycosyltransferase
MTKSAWVAGIAGVICLAVFFRGHQLAATPPGLFLDEAANGTDALHAIHTGRWAVFYPQNGGREGLFINLQSVLLRATGIREPWVLRSASAVFGVLTVFGVVLLGNELLGRQAALIAGFLMSVGFWHVNFSRIGFRAISAPFFLTWALFLLIVSCRAMRQEGLRTRSVAWGLLAGSVFGLGFHSYTAYRIAPVIFGFGMICLLRQRPSRSSRRAVAVQGLVIVAAAAAAASPLFLYFRHHPAAFTQRISQVSPSLAAGAPAVAAIVAHNTLATFAMLLTRGDLNWRHNVSGAPELWLPVGLLFVLGLIWCLTGRPRRFGFPRDWAPRLLMAWLAAGALPAILANEGTPHSLRSILMIPAVFLIAAIGFVGLYRSWPAGGVNWLRATIAAAFLASVAVQGYVQYFVVWRNDPRVREAFGSRFLSAADAIREAMEEHAESPVYIVVAKLEVGDEFFMAQPVMFLTDTGDQEGQARSKVHYVREGMEADIPAGSLMFHVR